MKKLLCLILFGLLLVAIPSFGFAAENVVEGQLERSGDGVYEVAFVIQTAADGSITATTFSDDLVKKLKGKYFLQVDAFPTPEGTAPAAADLVVCDENGVYYLGSVDGGATAYAGLNLIHATLPKSCLPSMYLTGSTSHVNYYWPVRGALTFDIINQATDTAHITLIFVFVD